jgi:hypothetical protein
MWHARRILHPEQAEAGGLVGTRIILSKDTVEQIARLYDQTYDRQVFPDKYLTRSHLTREEFASTGYRYPVRTHLTVDELQRIMDWKNPRGKTLKYAEKNGAERVGAVTRSAFSKASPVEAVGELGQLDGVEVRMASAILTVFDPLRYTVLDGRTWSALKELGLLDALNLAHFDPQPYSPGMYGAYLNACVQLAEAARVSLRTLDRCLWTLDERSLYGWARDGVSLSPIVSWSSPPGGPASLPKVYAGSEVALLDQY